MITFLKDLFYGNGNKYADLGRILVCLTVLAECAAGLWNARLGQPLDVGPSGFGGGLAAILAAGIAAVAAKDWAATNATSQAKKDETAALVPEARAAAIDAETEELGT